jgi:replicative DNA helicase
MFKEAYVVEKLDGPLDDISADLLKNIEIKFPKFIHNDKFNTIKIEEDSLTLFVAKSGNGKTFFLVDFMRECLLQGMKCFFFSLEMTKEGLLSRYSVQDEIRKSENLILKDRFIMSIDNLETTIKYYKKSIFGIPDLIFIDYIQHLSTENENFKDFG